MLLNVANIAYSSELVTLERISAGLRLVWNWERTH